MTTASDGYSGVTLRDTTGLAGGERGHVNTTTYTRTIVGKDIKAFEWSALHVLDNYADAGENVAMYAQSNKHGSGPTWGAVVEACDTTPGDASGLVGLEVDCWVSGPDNGERFGIDVVLGDAKQFRGEGPSGAVVGTAALRIGSSNRSTGAKWATGIDLSGANVGTAIKLGAGQFIQIGGARIDASTGMLAKAAIAIAVLALLLPLIQRLA